MRLPPAKALEEADRLERFALDCVARIDSEVAIAAHEALLLARSIRMVDAQQFGPPARVTDWGSTVVDFAARQREWLAAWNEEWEAARA